MGASVATAPIHHRAPGLVHRRVHALPLGSPRPTGESRPPDPTHDTYLPAIDPGHAITHGARNALGRTHTINADADERDAELDHNLATEFPHGHLTAERHELDGSDDAKDNEHTPRAETTSGHYRALS